MTAVIVVSISFVGVLIALFNMATHTTEKSLHLTCAKRYRMKMRILYHILRRDTRQDRHNRQTSRLKAVLY